MNATQMYIELIVIGLETSVWMSMIYINIVGDKAISVLSNILNNFSSSLLLIGVLYIIGILTDRLADMIFQKKEDNIRKKSGLKAKTSIIIWEKYNKGNFFNYTKSRIRILRASIINLPLVMVACIWYTMMFKSEKIFLMIYVFILGSLFTFIAIKTFTHLVTNYYNKTRLLELELENEGQ